MATKRGPGVGRTPRYERVPHGSLKGSFLEGEKVEPPKRSTAMIHVDKPAMKPSSVWRHKGKFAGSAALAGGGALYLTHHHRNQKELAVSKTYFDPFTGDTVEFAEPVEKFDVAKSVQGFNIKDVSTGPANATLTGAKSLGVKMSVKGENTKPRRNTLGHYRGSGTSGRRVVSIKAGK